MRVNIDGNEAINGWRVDVIDSRTNTTYKENFETYIQVLNYLTEWVKKESNNITLSFNYTRGNLCGLI